MCRQIWREIQKFAHSSCDMQFKAMLFGQLSYRESLRDVVTCLDAHHEKLYHLGFKTQVKRSTLSDANNKHDWRVYRDLAMLLIQKIRPMDPLSKEMIDLDIDGAVYLLDSSVINLCLSMFGWAKYDNEHSAVKLHMQLRFKR